jgi:arylsulfatase A-like enzyme
MLDLAGLDPQAALSRDWPAYQNIIPGRSLVPILKGETDRIREFAYCEYDIQWSMIHSDKYSYVRYPTGDPDNPRELLFDLENDPNECHDLAGCHDLASVLQWHRNRLTHLQETHPPAQTSWAPYGPRD